MKIKASAIAAASLLAFAVQAASAAEVVGYNVVTVPANSDVLVSVPFNKGVEATLTVATVSGSSIVVDETLTPGTYNSSYYIRFTSGAAAGLWSTISANGSNGVDVTDSSILSGVVAGDTFQVIEHHTVSSLFAAGLEDVVWNTSTKVLLPANDTAGINKGYTVVAYSSGAWKSGRTDYSNQVVEPGQGLIVRNESASALNWIAYGDVAEGNVAQLLPAGEYDIVVSGFEVPVRLADLGLEGKGSVLLPANASAGYNKGYTVVNYDGSAWKSGRTNYDDVEIQPGEGFIIRRTYSAVAEAWTVNP